MAVINYLRNNYTYTLYPNCPTKELTDENGNVVLDENGDPVMVFDITADSNLEAFLFDIKEGYCVHFATSAVALLRELGFAVSKPLLQNLRKGRRRDIPLICTGLRRARLD